MADDIIPFAIQIVRLDRLAPPLETDGPAMDMFIDTVALADLDREARHRRLPRRLFTIQLMIMARPARIEAAQIEDEAFLDAHARRNWLSTS